MPIFCFRLPPLTLLNVCASGLRVHQRIATHIGVANFVVGIERNMSLLLLVPSWLHSRRPSKWRTKLPTLLGRHSKRCALSEQQQRQDMTGLMKFLQEDCPMDVVPKIMAFCGPQTIAALSQTNRHWRDVCWNDATWRILCEELYKVSLLLID